MKASIIIATLNRPDDLRSTLSSISGNTTLPDEVIIVDQGDFGSSEKVLQKFNNLNIKHLPLVEKSLTKARNLGIKNCLGEILFFFDDDVEIDSDYIKNAIEFMEAHKEVRGLTGHDLKQKQSNNLLRRLFGVLFCISSFSGKSVILRSGQNVLRNFSDNIQSVGWLSGCNMVIRRKVFDGGLRFNENFVHWCYGEDVMLTYQIYKQYPGSLQYLPQLQLKHNQSPTGRLTNKQLVRMRIIYRYIFWKREISQNKTFNTFCYLWSQLGLSVIELPRVFAITKTYLYLLKYRKAIVKNEINYNDFIINNN